MKINFLNSYSTFLPVQKNSPDKPKTSKNKISGENILSYLNNNGSYNLSFGIRPSRAIYAIDKNGDYVRYDSVSEAAKDLNCTAGTNISKCANTKKGTCADRTFLYADEAEQVENDGTIAVDMDKIKERQNALIEALGKRPADKSLYAIDKEGNYAKYDKVTDAAKDLEISNSHIHACLSKQRKTTGGYTFIYADEIEHTTPDGKQIIDTRVSPELFENKTHTEIYSIDNEGKIRFHESIASAGKELGVALQNIHSCLNGKYQNCNGYAFVRADEILTKNRKGEEVLDGKILEEKYQNLIKNAVYVIDKEGKNKRYKNAKEAAIAIGSQNGAVIQCANGKTSNVKGYKILKAGEIESLKSGKLTKKKKILRECGQEAIELEHSKHIIAMREEDNFKKEYSSREEASADLGIPAKDISKCLCRHKKQTHGYWFKRVPTKKQEVKKQKIYSIFNGVNIQEFEDIKTASKNLNIQVKDIEYFLRCGQTQDGEKMLNGYVFATDEDK